jgi:hypothetical protein
MSAGKRKGLSLLIEVKVGSQPTLRVVGVAAEGNINEEAAAAAAEAAAFFVATPIGPTGKPEV